MDKLSLIIIIPAYNAGKWIGKSIAILKAQTYSYYQAIVIDDFSTDDTWPQIKEAVGNDGRFCLRRNESRKLKLYNVVTGIKQMSPDDEDVIMVIDGDDWLFDDGSLRHVVEAYNKYDCWMTYGRMICWPSGEVRERCVQIDGKYNIRRDGWIFTQLRTYKYFLWKNVLDKDLRDYAAGDYYGPACDTAIFRPMLEMAGYEKVVRLSNVVYTCNLKNPLSDDRINLALQKRNDYEIECRVPYKKRSKESLIEEKKDG